MRVKHRVALLVFVGKVPYPVLAQSFVATVPRVMKFLSSHQPPLIAKVYRAMPRELERNSNAPGRVELWYPRAG